MNPNDKMSEGYCVFIETAFEGLVPSLYDARNMAVVFATEEEAEAEIQDLVDTRLSNAVNDEERSIYSQGTEEFVLKVRFSENGAVLHVIG